MHLVSRQRSSGEQPCYRGRVRTGCLTCRSRKVKCDEARPICSNCTKGSRQCVYKPKKCRYSTAAAQISGKDAQKEIAHILETGSLLQTYTDLMFVRETAHNSLSSSDGSSVNSSARLEITLRRQDDTLITTDSPELDSLLPSTLISQDIKLTTTMDRLVAHEISLQPWFSFFVEEVDYASITPFDGVNWRRMKIEMVNIGTTDAVIASAIIAVSVLYQAQLHGLPLSKALSLYQASRKNAFVGEIRDFSTILAAAFLLCLFEFINYETESILKEPSEAVINSLKTWAQSESSQSALSLRIVAWLRLLQAAAIRGGGKGLISENICNMLPSCSTGIPNLKLPSNQDLDASTHLFEIISTPIFEFYFRLQMISGEIAKLTHYHRSRTTGVDQEDVGRLMSHVKSRLRNLWDHRPTTQRQTPEDIRSHLAPKIANPIIALIGVCNAAYYAEFIEIDRVLGDPLSESIDSRQAMRHIRELVDGDWNAYGGGRLSAGYLRPLFLYAIECMDRDENQWAVERLEDIKDPICRSKFFASFGKALSDAQLRKDRRVTSRYFCISNFGVPPPFM